MSYHRGRSASGRDITVVSYDAHILAQSSGGGVGQVVTRTNAAGETERFLYSQDGYEYWEVEGGSPPSDTGAVAEERHAGSNTYNTLLPHGSNVASSSGRVTDQDGNVTDILGGPYDIRNGANQYRPHKAYTTHTRGHFKPCGSCSDMATEHGFTFEDELRYNTRNELSSVRTHPACLSAAVLVSVGQSWRTVLKPLSALSSTVAAVDNHPGLRAKYGAGMDPTCLLTWQVTWGVQPSTHADSAVGVS